MSGQMPLEPSGTHRSVAAAGAATVAQRTSVPPRPEKATTNEAR